MKVATMLKRPSSARMARKLPGDASDWVNVASGAALLLGGALMLTEKRRAGLALASAGTALALLEHQDTVRHLWDRLPGMVDELSSFVAEVEQRVGEFTSKKESLRNAVADVAERLGVRG